MEKEEEDRGLTLPVIVLSFKRATMKSSCAYQDQMRHLRGNTAHTHCLPYF
jgi:hypothetical protein